MVPVKSRCITSVSLKASETSPGKSLGGRLQGRFGGLAAEPMVAASLATKETVAGRQDPPRTGGQEPRGHVPLVGAARHRSRNGRAVRHIGGLRAGAARAAATTASPRRCAVGAWAPAHRPPTAGPPNGYPSQGTLQQPHSAGHGAVTVQSQSVTRHTPASHSRGGLRRLRAAGPRLWRVRGPAAELLTSEQRAECFLHPARTAKFYEMTARSGQARVTPFAYLSPCVLRNELEVLDPDRALGGSPQSRSSGSTIPLPRPRRRRRRRPLSLSPSPSPP